MFAIPSLIMTILFLGGYDTVIEIKPEPPAIKFSEITSGTEEVTFDWITPPPQAR